MAGLASELARKAVHISMGGFAFALRWLTPWQAMLCAMAALLFNLFVLHRLTRRSLLREGERDRGFSPGIALYPAAVLVSILVFRNRLELAAGTWALLAFGDGMATVAGVLLRGPRLPWNPQKSWAGLLAFVLYGGAGAALVVPWVQRAVLDGGDSVTWIGRSFLAAGRDGYATDAALLLAGCFAAAVAAALAESLDTGIDDNILVPVVGGGVLFLAAMVEPGRLFADPSLFAARFAWGAGVNAVLAVAALASRGVTMSGALWGWVLGTLLWGLGGWPAFSALLAFFILGTACTKLGYARKHALGIAQEKGGRRGPRNAFANVSAGVVFAFLAVSTAHPTAFAVAVAAAFATAASDTVSSEIGQAYGRRHVLVTSFRRVPAGTDGAVSIEGTLGGVVASLIVAAVTWGTGLIPGSAIAVVAVAAFVGNTLESYVGAAFEGTARIDNELVNFSNTVAGGVVGAALAYWIGL